MNTDLPEHAWFSVVPSGYQWLSMVLNGETNDETKY